MNMIHSELTHSAWYRQYNSLHERLSDFIVHDGDWTGISFEAPASLTSAYSALQSIGYANGWL